MRGKGSSVLAVLVGAVLLVAGLIAQFVVIPGMMQFPEDVDSERAYEGEMAVMLNGEALAAGDLENVFIRDLPVSIERRVQALEVDGGSALVLDTAVLSGPAGPVNQAESTYTIDRKSMEAVPNFTDNANVIDREGLVIGFPIGTEAKDYLGFNGDTLSTNAITYAREEEKAGLDTYVFEATSGPDLITDPELLASFPPALPKDMLAQMVPAFGLPEEAVAQMAEMLPALPDMVPLAYFYTYKSTYWVEPDTGVLVDYEKMESRQVALNLGEQPLPVGEVMHLEYAQTDASVEIAAKEASDARSQLFWFGKVLPIALIAGGALIALFGLFRLSRRSV